MTLEKPAVKQAQRGNREYGLRIRCKEILLLPLGAQEGAVDTGGGAIAARVVLIIWLRNFLREDFCIPSVRFLTLRVGVHQCELEYVKLLEGRPAELVPADEKNFPVHFVIDCSINRFAAQIG